MLKTIKINSKTSIKLDNNIGWAIIYRDQFNHDILPDIMPVIAAALDILIQSMNKDDIKTTEDLLKNLDVDDIEDALIRLSALEVTTLINICWSMAKLADSDIDEPLEWVKQFSAFPVDVIAPALFEILAQGLVSSKNLKRLQTVLKPADQ